MDQEVDLEKAEQPKRARRYVGTKESVGFVLYDVAASWNIAKYDTNYLTDVLRVGFSFTAVFAPILAIWDIINDIFLASLIEKTRTRFGKFRPYLVAYALIAVPIIAFYYMMGTFLGDASAMNPTKLALYAIVSIVRNLADSTSAIARTGIIATITPDIRERTRLITQAQFLSGLIEKAPEILFGAIFDLTTNGAINTKVSSLFAVGGFLTVIGSGIMAFYFAVKCKERVPQSLESPRVKESFHALASNRPLLLQMLAEFLGAFGINPGTPLYFNGVLKFNSMTTIVGIPGAIVSPLSYTYIPALRQKFSMRTLWIVGSHLNDLLMFGVCGVGLINNNFKKRLPMIAAFMLQETIFMTVYGIRKVIPEELRNEAIDYGEWKNGYRTESMTGVAKGLPAKLLRSVGESVKAIILKRIGYDQFAEVGTQTIEVQRRLFIMVTILPVVTGIMGIVPKLFYNIDVDTRTRMYAELNERRAAIAANVKQEDEA
ncbi:MAG: MFS transporter [Oscillospiraceae bacterium]|jgi:Na+/melibiose symporter-like transporter|nr:MFS transporter [Oscillospiraceae bacterium]